MWLRNGIAIEVSRVASTPLGFLAWDEVSETRLDLQGTSLTCAVAIADGAPAFYTPTVEITDEALGEFEIIFDGSEFSSISGTQDTVILSYQVKADDGDRSVIMLRGPLILTPGI